jgi:ribosome-associated heat shock protein Hsp15
MTGGTLRLDKFLFFARITKTRCMAQRIIAQGHVRMNGKPALRAHECVALGTVITLPLHDGVRVIRVERIPGRRGPPAEAQSCYCDPTSTYPIDGARE